ncbi:MAG: ribosomal protein S1 [Planctomycetota bacterium]|jgi:small subunit ribosomal protein S1
MSRFRPKSLREAEARGEIKERGAHTLEVVDGTIVGKSGNDVFVELGVRKQGVIDLRAFQREPKVGEVRQFTLRGREDALWILNLAEEETLEVWEDLEEGSLITGRVSGLTHDGFQVKIGQLHAYMPFSVSGVRRSRDRKALMGRAVVVLVLDVDDDKQRAIVSRKAVLQMQRNGGAPNSVVPGQTIQGRISRIEPYGVFIRFGQGREGLCHISNLSVDRIDHPSDVVSKGEVVEARVLYVRQGGKRIGLGLKQTQESPWIRLEREHWEGQIVPVEFIRVGTFGAIARLLPGIEGIVPISECAGLGPGRGLLQGDQRSARIMELDIESERIAFSLTHEGGRAVDRDEAETVRAFDVIRRSPTVERVMGSPEAPPSPGAGTNIGDLLRRAMEQKEG